MLCFRNGNPPRPLNSPHPSQDQSLPLKAACYMALVADISAFAIYFWHSFPWAERLRGTICVLTDLVFISHWSKLGNWLLYCIVLWTSGVVLFCVEVIIFLPTLVIRTAFWIYSHSTHLSLVFSNINIWWQGWGPSMWRRRWWLTIMISSLTDWAKEVSLYQSKWINVMYKWSTCAMKTSSPFFSRL